MENEDYCLIADEARGAALSTAQNELTLYHDLQLQIKLIKDKVQCGSKQCCIFMVGTEATFKLCHELRKMNRDLLDYFAFNKCLKDLLPRTRFRFRCHLRTPPTGEVTILKQIEGKDISCQELMNELPSFMNESIGLVHRIEGISKDMASCMPLTERKTRSESSNAIVKSLKDLTTELHSLFSDVKDPDKVAATIDNRWSQLYEKSEELAEQSRRFIASLEKPIENPQANTMDLESQENNKKHLLELVKDTSEFTNRLEKLVPKLEDVELTLTLEAEEREVFHDGMPRCEIKRDFAFPALEEVDYGPSGKVWPEWAFEIRTFDLAKVLRWAIDSETGNPSFSKPNDRFGNDENLPENEEQRQERIHAKNVKDTFCEFKYKSPIDYSNEELLYLLLGSNFDYLSSKTQIEISQFIRVDVRTLRGFEIWDKLREAKNKGKHALGNLKRDCKNKYDKARKDFHSQNSIVQKDRHAHQPNSEGV